MIDEGLSRVFRTMEEHEVSCLLMGGQACIIYGAAEFSKDVDFAVLSDSRNIDRLKAAMASLEAEVIAVPPFEVDFLNAGLAVHFRCGVAGLEGLRVDVMSRMRNVEGFELLWKRRFRVSDGQGGTVNLMALSDLVQAKKTQRDKDWPMIQRLLEVDYLSSREQPTPDRIGFWLKELRTPELLIEAAQRFSSELELKQGERPLLEIAKNGSFEELERALMDEMLKEKARDREYWAPLKVRLGELRRSARRQN